MSFALVARLVYAAGILAIGLQLVVRAAFQPELQPVPAWVPAQPALAVATGALLVIACAGLITGYRARLAARVLVVMFGLWLVALHVPQLIMRPRSGGAWTVALEVLGFACAAWWLADGPRPGLARVALGLAFVGFGVLHVRHADYVAAVIPAWIPGAMAWAYLTAAAHAAAGLAIATGIAGRLAATLLGAMLASWVVILHAPRVIAASDARGEWTSMFVALAMAGAAWVARGTLAR